MSCRECGSPTTCYAGCPNEPPDFEHDDECMVGVESQYAKDGCIDDCGCSCHTLETEDEARAERAMEDRRDD